MGEKHLIFFFFFTGKFDEGFDYSRLLSKETLQKCKPLLKKKKKKKQDQR